MHGIAFVVHTQCMLSDPSYPVIAMEQNSGTCLSPFLTVCSTVAATALHLEVTIGVVAILPAMSWLENM